LIIHDKPPNFELISLHFPAANNDGVVFAFDGHIYNPSGRILPPALIAHEDVHLKRQVEHGAGRWWNDYILDPEFRYHEELLAHVAEFKALRNVRDRNHGVRLLMSTALRLIAPLYKYSPPRTLFQACRDLQREIARK
jgi:hypothetical protein